MNFSFPLLEYIYPNWDRKDSTPNPYYPNFSTLKFKKKFSDEYK